VSVSKTIVIAEVGTTWLAHYTNLASLMGHVKNAGADYLKLQWCSDPAQLAKLRKMDSVPESYFLLHFPFSWFRDIRAGLHAAGLGFACSVYLGEDHAAIRDQVDAVKIASFESEAFPAIALDREQYLWISTGMSATLDDVARIARAWDLRAADILFHCVSAYPMPLHDANLGAIDSMRRFMEGKRPNVKIGFSDHSRWTGMGACAVLAGAQALEVHVRLDSTPDDHPDCSVALRPAELAEYVANVRFAEQLLGDGVKRVMPSEQENVRWKR
jgi:N,N'-diacetyllegionaminate synthase